MRREKWVVFTSSQTSLSDIASVPSINLKCSGKDEKLVCAECLLKLRLIGEPSSSKLVAEEEYQSSGTRLLLIFIFICILAMGFAGLILYKWYYPSERNSPKWTNILYNSVRVLGFN